MNALDFIVRCGDERIAIRIQYEDARRDAHKSSLEKACMGRAVIIERCGRIIERWKDGERMKP